MGLLGNDSVVTDGWLEGLIRWSVHDRPHNGLVGVVTNYAAAPQEVEVSNQNLDEMHTFSKDWKAQRAGQAFELQRLIGFCLLMRRDVWDKVGSPDERARQAALSYTSVLSNETGVLCSNGLHFAIARNAFYHVIYVFPYSTEIAPISKISMLFGATGCKEPQSIDGVSPLAIMDLLPASVRCIDTLKRL